MRPSAHALQRLAARLEPRKAAVVERWLQGLEGLAEPAAPDRRGFCARGVDALLEMMARGDVGDLLADEAAQAGAILAAGGSLEARFRAGRVLERALLAVLLEGGDAASCAEEALAVHELAEQRMAALLHAQQERLDHGLHEAEEHAAHLGERARELKVVNEMLRRAQAQSQHRAGLIEMLSAVVHRIAGVLDPDLLMQEAAEVIQARLNHTYVAVVVLDDEGVVVGRWSGRKGVGRRSAGRAQGPAGGIIGRTLRKRAPQVVPDVERDPDYFADVPGTRSEMAVPLLENGEAIGAIDFQSETLDAFGLDAVAVGETLAEFLVQALRNARLFAETKRAEADRT